MNASFTSRRVKPVASLVTCRPGRSRPGQGERIVARGCAGASPGWRERHVTGSPYHLGSLRLIRSLTSAPPTLEELFLRHYQAEQVATPAGDGQPTREGER